MEEFLYTSVAWGLLTTGCYPSALAMSLSMVDKQQPQASKVHEELGLVVTEVATTLSADLIPSLRP